jgi:hypothetical protein
MITAPILSMFVIPAAYILLRRRQRKQSTDERAKTVATVIPTPLSTP